jgi:lysophospholipase L1-like esterase
MSLVFRGRLILTTIAAASLSCASKTVTPPSPVFEDPQISCPSDIEALSHDRHAPAIPFDIPSATKGSPPVTVTCSPEAGSEFPDGTTAVTCEASDSRAHKASCTFSVIVTPVPRLMKTRFLAFGDSLTEGKTSVQATTAVSVPPVILNLPGSYPEILEAKLSARYRDQTVTMIAYGVGGEFAFDGKERLKAHWSELNPDAVLILEGVNDLTDFSVQTPQGLQEAMNHVMESLEDTVAVVRSHGAQPFLATLTPVTTPYENAGAALPSLNNRIKALAARLNVPLVDLFSVVDKNDINTTGPHPGIHPKPFTKAYENMADAWLKAIISTLEVKN